MTPLPPGAIKHLLETLPPERPDPFPHLAVLSTDALLKRRVEISGQLKTLEKLDHLSEKLRRSRTGTLDFLITHYEWFEKHRKEVIG